MFRKIALAGATAAAIVGVGTAAIAASGPSATPGAGSTAGSTKTGQTQQQGNNANGKHGKHKGQKLRAALRHTVHGSVVTKGKDGYVVHTAVRGTVTAVSATSLTVKAADGYSKTFTIDKTTKIREKAAQGKKPTAGTVSDLKTGDKVGVIGKGADKANAVTTATIVLDGLTK